MQDKAYLLQLARVASAERAMGTEAWWYLSFADDVFHGAILVLAKGIVTARLRVSELGHNPKGEVLGVPVPDHLLPAAEFRDRLLTKEDLCVAFAESGGMVNLDGEHLEVNRA